jgi:hypothetical protein
MLIRIGGFLVLLAALYGISLLPERFREQGRNEIRGEIKSSVATERRVRLAENALLRAENARNLRELKNAHKIEIDSAKSFFNQSGGLRFNKARICAGETRAKTEATSASIGIESTTPSELLPEPYSGNLKKLMLEADNVVAQCRIAQEAIKKSDSIEIVHENNQ